MGRLLARRQCTVTHRWHYTASTTGTLASCAWNVVPPVSPTSGIPYAGSNHSDRSLHQSPNASLSVWRFTRLELVVLGAIQQEHVFQVSHLPFGLQVLEGLATESRQAIIRWQILVAGHQAKETAFEDFNHCRRLIASLQCRTPPKDVVCTKRVGVCSLGLLQIART